MKEQDWDTLTALNFTTFAPRPFTLAAHSSSPNFIFPYSHIEMMMFCLVGREFHAWANQVQSITRQFPPLLFGLQFFVFFHAPTWEKSHSRTSFFLFLTLFWASCSECIQTEFYGKKSQRNAAMSMAMARSDISQIKKALSARQQLRSSDGAAASSATASTYSAVPPPDTLLACSWPSPHAAEEAAAMRSSLAPNFLPFGETDLSIDIVLRVLEYYSGLPSEKAAQAAVVQHMMRCTTKVLALQWNFCSDSFVRFSPQQHHSAPAPAPTAAAKPQQRGRRAMSQSSPANAVPSTGFGVSQQAQTCQVDRERQVEREQLNALIAAILTVGLKKGIYQYPPSATPHHFCLHVDLSMRFKARGDGGLDAVFRCGKCDCGVSTAAGNVGGPLRRTKFFSRLTDENFIISLMRFFKQSR
jgi:hypothetical protein